MDELISRGIIIQQNNYGDAHRMLSIFTEKDGIIKAVRYGIRGHKTANAAAFQLFCYGDFKLKPARGEVMPAVSAEIIDAFMPVSEDIEKLSLLSYLADITHVMLEEYNPDKRVLSLFLNIVYAAAYRDEPLLKLKTVYEMKLMSACGYMPNIGRCGVCGEEAKYFSITRGCTVCQKHSHKEDLAVSAGAVAVMKHIINCSDKKMLSFKLKDDALYEELNKISEQFVSCYAYREFSSLSYFYSMMNK